VTLWKTVDGVYTADPRCCDSAFSVPFLSYEEAMELAYFGGQVSSMRLSHRSMLA
jgi:aspartokinase